jgi:RHS repeat-associated protein
MGFFHTAAYADPPVTPKTVRPERQLQVPGLRSYSPSLGRWLSRDPIGERGGGNLRAFVGNRPTMSVDPLGRQALPAPVPDPWVFPPPGREIIQGGSCCPGQAVEELPAAGCLGRCVKVGAVFLTVFMCPTPLGPEPDPPVPPPSPEPWPEEPPDGLTPKGCKPCVPRAGTTFFRVDIVPPSRPHRPFKGTHTHHGFVHQSPAPKCVCTKHWPMPPLDCTEGADRWPDEIPEPPIVTGGGPL